MGLIVVGDSSDYSLHSVLFLGMIINDSCLEEMGIFNYREHSQYNSV